MFEHGVTKTVADNIATVASRRQRRRRPDLSGFFIPKIKGFTAEIGDRIVVPGRETKFMRILGPGVSTAGLRHHSSEIWVCQDVNPRNRRSGPGIQGDNVFATVCIKAAGSVIK